MKATVDPELCIGCGMCAEVCPEVFRMENGKAVVFVDSVPKPAEGSCKQAADGCPVVAIKVDE